MSEQVTESIQLYASLARNHDRETRFITGIRKDAIGALQPEANETVLDAGCGTGWCLPALSAAVTRTGRVIGFEPSPDTLAIARARARKQGINNVKSRHACGETVE